ncbi:MAG: outer membrane lipoprotein-sorting protein [Candidatus Hydrothermales bacterium]
MNLILIFSILNGNEILKKVEDTYNAPSDRVSELKMVLVESDGTQKEREMKIWMKGKHKKLFVFKSPADVKGVGFLVLSDDELYIYLPAFKKIRRIASHVKNESFMGTDFSYNDLAKSEFTKDYSAVIKEENENQYVLILTPKPESDVEYSKLIMFVNKKIFLPDSIKFFDKGNNLLKIMRNKKFVQIKNYWSINEIEMENVKDKHKTVMKTLKQEYDLGLSEEIFTQRNLKKAE